jgi:hypothetical protein
VDTREKIVPLAELRRRMANGEWLAVVGLFDPLTALQALRVTEVSNGDGDLAAIVLDQPDTLLSADARAALVAGLRRVRLVSIARRDEWRDALRQAKVFEDPTHSDEFVKFVLERQNRG